jgi:hypothetical protein
VILAKPPGDPGIEDNYTFSQRGPQKTGPFCFSGGAS